MTLDLDNLPASMKDALQKKVREEKSTLEQAALDAMAKGLGVHTGKRKRDLSRFRGKWIEDPEVDAALASFRTVDPEMWK